MPATLTLEQLIDALAIRVEGPRCWDADIAVRFVVRGGDTVTPAPGRPRPIRTWASLSPRGDLRALLLGALTPAAPAARDGVEVSGDIGRLTELLGHLGAPDPDFAIVTP